MIPLPMTAGSGKRLSSTSVMIPDVPSLPESRSVHLRARFQIVTCEFFVVAGTRISATGNSTRWPRVNCSVRPSINTSVTAKYVTPHRTVMKTARTAQRICSKYRLGKLYLRSD